MTILVNVDQRGGGAARLAARQMALLFERSLAAPAPPPLEAEPARAADAATVENANGKTLAAAGRQPLGRGFSVGACDGTLAGRISRALIEYARGVSTVPPTVARVREEVLALAVISEGKDVPVPGGAGETKRVFVHSSGIQVLGVRGLRADDIFLA